MKLNEITKLSEFMEMLDWQLDENGLVITDLELLADAVMRTFPELEDDISSDEDDDA
jgi:hypothetical protein